MVSMSPVCEPMEGTPIVASRPALFARAALLASLGLLALLCIVNSFAKHLTPDNSIYLLHARTFVQTLDRFSLSHDSKGILLTLVLAPCVWIFGATMAAAASAQLVAYGVGFMCLYGLIRSYAYALDAAIICLLGICVVCSHLIWGGNARPEDFAVAYIAVALLASWRRTRGWLLLGGGMAACCLFTKTTLVLAPAAVLIAGCVVADSDAGSTKGKQELREGARIVRHLLWAGLGFALVTTAILAWISLFDSLPGWYRQTIQWPATYRAASIPGLAEISATLALARGSGLHYLLGISLLGLLVGWLKGARRLAVLVAVLLLAELLRIAIEGARWPYTLTIAILPMLVGASLLGIRKGASRPSSLWHVAAPLFCLVPLLAVSARAEATAFELRLLRRLPSPCEYLAAQMHAAGYRQGESVFVLGNDYQLILLLGAPAPAPVLPLHYLDVSAEEQLATRRFYAQRPPVWVAALAPLAPADKLPILGSVDGAYDVVLPTDAASLRVSRPVEVAGSDLCPVLPHTAKYRALVDTGYRQIWRLAEVPR